MHLDGDMQLTLGQCTYAGIKADNEDSIGIYVPDGHALTTKGAVAVIADGVSAAEAGKEASDTCVTSFLADYYSTPESWTVKKSTQQVLNALNRWLYGQGQRFIQAEKGYVCTLSIIIFKSRTAHLFHVGDTRIYRLRKGELEQLTRDHATRINKEQSYLTRAMGLDVWLDVDYRAVDLEEGDVFFTSSDGVHDFMRRSELQSLLGTLEDDAEELCNKIVAQALENQSDDNLSCQILRIDRLPSEQAGDVYQKLTALPFPPYLEPGMVVDGYRIEREIHASNRSQLYVVTDKESGQPFVMKTPSVNYEDDPAYIERFVMESWIGRRIQSPHVVTVLDDVRPKSCLYYLSECVDGQSLGEWMKDNPHPATNTVIALLEQLARGLRAFHRKQTFHQDIKPDNMVIDGEGCLKLIDFGSCYVSGIAEISAPFERDVVLGTAQYSAPEHILGQKPSALADQFSMAVIAFEMLTGKLPYEGKLEKAKTPADFSRLHYIPAYQYNPHVPVWMDGALKKALSVSPELRYADISEFMHDLTTPNPAFMSELKLPLAQRNPLRFWQAVSAIQLVLLLLSLLIR